MSRHIGYIDMCSVTWVVPRTISYQRSSAAITLDLCSLTPCTATSTILHPANSAWWPASPQQHVYATDLRPLDTSTHFSVIRVNAVQYSLQTQAFSATSSQASKIPESVASERRVLPETSSSVAFKNRRRFLRKRGSG